jgi:hypothetical protein
MASLPYVSGAKENCNFDVHKFATIPSIKLRFNIFSLFNYLLAVYKSTPLRFSQLQTPLDEATTDMPPSTFSAMTQTFWQHTSNTSLSLFNGSIHLHDAYKFREILTIVPFLLSILTQTATMLAKMHQNHAPKQHQDLPS